MSERDRAATRALRHARNARPRGCASATLARAPARAQVALRQVAHAPAFARDPRRRRCPQTSPRAQRWPRCRSRASRSCVELQKRSAGRSAASPQSAGRRRCACSRRPGPIYEPEGAARDYWRLARALFAAGFRARRPRAQLLSRITSRPAGSMLENAARTRSAARCFPAAPARPSSRCRRWPTCAPDGYVGTPSFLQDHAREGRRARASRCRQLTKALVSGEAVPAGLRDALAARGIAGYQVYATADLGAIAYEIAGARGAGRRRRRARRDRASRHRRPGAPTAKSAKSS